MSAQLNYQMRNNKDRGSIPRPVRSFFFFKIFQTKNNTVLAH